MQLIDCEHAESTLAIEVFERWEGMWVWILCVAKVNYLQENEAGKLSITNRVWTAVIQGKHGQNLLRLQFPPAEYRRLGWGYIKVVQLADDAPIHKIGINRPPSPRTSVGVVVIDQHGSRYAPTRPAW